jgi:hypothetical protein
MATKKKKASAAKRKTTTKTKPAAPKTKAKAPATRTAAPKKAGGGGGGTREKPWALKTPPGSSAFEAFRDDTLDPPALVVRVGKTELRYHLRAIEDLHAMLKKHGDWMLLGGADEQKPAADGTVEAWGRSAKNPVKGWYGLKKGLRGRFGVYVPPVLEALGLAEVEHGAKNNRMRAK